MKIRSLLLINMIFLAPVFSQPQDLNNKILVTVGGNKVQAGEFIRMYKKSLDPGKAQNVDSYLQQYIVFKLKVSDAIEQGYDTTKAFKTELNGYRNQLAQNYLTDTLTKEKILRKAYQRSLTEINAWHILIALAPEASAEDTIKAWEKANNIRKRIINGESFELVARGTSDDRSVKVNGGNLGYFTAFQMIMPFEDAAYSLDKGAVSEPVRTPYGYHIIKVTDRRPSAGRMKVAHIMKSIPPGTGENEAKLAENEIMSIYKKLQDGASFRELAIKYSDHKESAAKGGELNWFGTGEIISDFSEAAFSIRDTGSYSKPVHTPYGWHIIKLLDRKPQGSYKESRSFLESRISQPVLNSICKKSFVEKLKKEYGFTINQDAYKWFVRNTDTLIIRGLRKYDRTNIPEIDLYTFADLHITANRFTAYIEKNVPVPVTDNSVSFLNSLIESSASDEILTYENSVLENKYPEFGYLMNEFHDGILLFDISGKKLWNRESDDSAGLRRYYENHRTDFLSRRGLDAKIYTLKSRSGEKSLVSAYEKYSGKPDTDNLLRKKFNKGNDTLLVISERIWFGKEDPEIDKLKWAAGKQVFRKDDFPSIIIIKNVIEPVQLSFDEAKGEILKGYQDYLENEWIGQLKGKYNVKIVNLILEEVKKELSNE
jgi:peptidyl-prolyl cis-trans isomerase SurA